VTIEIRIELDDHWQIYTDKNGQRYATTIVEEDDEEWITAQLFEMGKEDYGTHHHNSASIIIKNDEYEEEVSTRISVADPRGGFVMESRVNETGHYLSVPTNQSPAPHVDDMEERGKGFYKLTHMPVKKADEEE
jgi:hypothetical protein